MLSSSPCLHDRRAVRVSLLQKAPGTVRVDKPGGQTTMAGVGVGLLLVAIGAILRFAVYAPNQHANWGTIGVILMIVGAIGFLVGLIIEMPRRFRRQETYVQRPDGSAERVVQDRQTI
jgi:Na+/melibiose symporter-like transporter